MRNEKTDTTMTDPESHPIVPTKTLDSNPPLANSVRPHYIKDLVLLFSIPIAICLIAAAVVYVPRFAAHPKNDFVYSACESYDCTGSYSIDSSGVIQKDGTDSDSDSNTGIFHPLLNTTTSNRVTDSSLSNTTDSTTDSYVTSDDSAQLRMYDSKTDSWRDITLAEAQKYHVERSSKSSDGYILIQKDTSSSLPFEDDDGGTSWFLKNGLKQKKVILTNDQSDGSDEIKFIGWIGDAR